MTDTEIDRRLALAIGWPEHSVRHRRQDVYRTFVFGDRFNHGFMAWWTFSHKDPAVILPIMERYDCFPYSVAGGWNSVCASTEKFVEEQHEHPRTAAALAVIKAKAMGLI